MHESDVVIVGAGAAGIGASRMLRSLNVPHVVLEAKDRVGGRAYSDTTSLGYLWDHGCHWFHSADINVLRDAAIRLGHRFREQPAAASLNTFLDGEWKSASLRFDYVWSELSRFVEAGKQGLDVPVSTLLDSTHKLEPLVRHWVQLMYSADPEMVSTRDAANYRDTSVNLPVEDGYGTLVSHLSEGLPVHLNTPVEGLSVTRYGVDVETRSGTLTARAVVLAVPARMIETDRISIIPRLDDGHREAFENVPMGWYEKIAISFDRQVFDQRTGSYADMVNEGEHPLNFELHPFGRPIAVTHVAGSAALELERQGEKAMIDFALAALERAFGSGIRKRVARGTTSGWTADSFINGAYSCARPGKAENRRHFRHAVHDRIFLAGEHTHPWFFATAHGAYESGQSAAARAAQLIGAEVPAQDPAWLPA
jgi:monoamine oxidase